MSEESVISMRGVYKTFGRTEVLKGVDFELKKGEIYGLIGRNGAGKTTIFKMILGLSKMNKGEIVIKGSTNQKELIANRRHVGFFISSCFYDYMTAKGNLEYYRVMKGIKDKKEIQRVLEIVGLAGVKTKYRGFSLGMKQRLGIANAIMGNPEILILDEPANGLDPQGIADVRNLIKRLNEEFGMTIIVSSHILGELEHTATRFGIVNQGVIASEITREDLAQRNHTVNVQIPASDSEKAEALLREAGIQVNAVVPAVTSLEDFYFDQMGGDGHA